MQTRLAVTVQEPAIRYPREQLLRHVEQTLAAAAENLPYAARIRQS